jgi:hypothetical protein
VAFPILRVQGEPGELSLDRCVPEQQALVEQKLCAAISLVQKELQCADLFPVESRRVSVMRHAALSSHCQEFRTW